MPDFGFVGPSYEAPSIYQDAQECINFYPEVDPLKQPGDRGVVALYGTPGLTAFFQFINAPVRGMHTMSGGKYCIIVVGANVYALDTSNNTYLVGTLTTSTGYVSITDNVMTANGLTAMIADGVNRYYWQVSPSVFGQMPASDGPWTGADIVDVVDNYVVYNQPNTRNWAVTDLGSPFSTSGYYGTKDGAPDNLVSVIVDHRQVYLLGETTSEVWVDVVIRLQELRLFRLRVYLAHLCNMVLLRHSRLLDLLNNSYLSVKMPAAKPLSAVLLDTNSKGYQPMPLKLH